MSVKRYEVNGSSSVFENENGSLVDYEDYAALEARCAALAAKNAGMKQETPDLQTMMSALDAFFADEEVPERAMLEAYNILRGAVETPATDAFLAELRAQESKRVYESILDNPAVTDMESLVDWLEQNANDSVAFAAQLRKGVPS